MMKRPDRETTTLAVIDIQERLAQAMNPEVFESMEANVGRLVEGFNALESHVVVTEQYPKGLGPTTPNVLKHLRDAVSPIEKVEFSCARADGFVQRLREEGAKSVVLTGMESHICVLQTAMDLVAEGFDVWVAQDAVCSRTKENWQAGLRLAQHAGAHIAPTETILFLLVGAAGSPEFKTISKLIK